MIATWMLYATLVGVLVTAAASALDAAARVSRLPARFVWLVAIVATAIAPFAGYAARRAAVNAAKPGQVTVGQVTGVALEAPAAANAISRLISGAGAIASRADRPVAYIWAALTLILLGRLVVATSTVWRGRAQWTARQIDGVPVFVTPDLGPAVVALPRSQILVPEWLLSLDSTQVATVVRHEREHHLAGDPRLLVFATLVTALFPWNVAMWWQSRRLRLAIEMDCDARVLAADPRVDRYGTLLLAIAQHPRAAMHVAATLTESTSDLERRIDAMTTPRPSAPRLIVGALSVVAVAAIFAACITPAPDVIAGPSSRSRESLPRLGTDTTSYFDFQVEKPATAAPGNEVPVYPNQLRAANIGGTVIVKFVVDTTGSVDMKSFETLKSDHDLFVRAVRNAVPAMHFIPAEVGGRKVRQMITMPFVFSLSEGKATATKTQASVPPAKPLIIVDGVVLDPNVSVTSTTSRDTTRARFGEMVTNPTTEVTGGITRNTPPKYPVQLRAANIEGQVVARFVVQPDGSVDMSTFMIVKSDHDLFSNAVRNAVTSYRFPLTIKDGTPARLLVTMPFLFSLSK